MIYYFSKQETPIIKNGVKHLFTDLSVEDSLLKLQKESVLALDVETTGLNPRSNRVIMLQLGTISGDQYVYDCRDFNPSIFTGLLNDRDKIFVGHNIKFDYNMLKQYGILLRKVYDTMLAEIVINNGKFSIDMIKKMKRFSLATVSKFYLREDLVKSTRDDISRMGNRCFTYDQIIYGAKDVEVVLKIAKIQKHHITKWKLEKCVKLENEVTLALGDIEYNGMHINQETWMKANQIFFERSKETEKKLDELLNKTTNKYKTPGFQLDLFKTEIDKRQTLVNWSSDSQVAEILKNVFNIYPTDKNGKFSTGAPAIKSLEKSNEITDLLLKHREESKAVTAFGKKFLDDYVDKDGRVHTTFNQIVETGRVSSRSPNMQQIPGGDGEDEDKDLFRKAFEAPEGKKIITADYSQQEARIMADKAGDKDYLKFFNEGDGDSHSFVGTKLFTAAFGKPFKVDKSNKKKQYRQKAKILNFMISYGGSAFTLSKQLKIPQEEAQELIDAFFKGFPTLKKMFEDCSKFGLNNGFIRLDPITNRIRWFREMETVKQLAEKDIGMTEEERKRFYTMKGSIERKSMNSPIQGTAGSMTKQALINIRKYFIDKLGINPFADADVKLVNVVHDEISVECSEDRAEEIAEIQKQCMEEAGNKFVKGTKVPAEPVISDYWAH